MTELGALSLRIDTIGDRAALQALGEIDRRATKVGRDTNPQFAASQRAISREIAETTRLYSLLGRTTDLSNRNTAQQMRQLADLQLRYLQELGATDVQLARHAAAIQQVERQITAHSRAVSLFGQSVVNAQGKVVGFGRSGLNAFNAVAFGLSQMAATGQMSFRTLATSGASVASFFGPTGAIVAAITSAGLVLADFFTRTRREVEETRRKTEEEIRELRRTIEEERQTGQQEQLIRRVETATRRLASAEQERTAILETLAPIDARYATLRQISSVAVALAKRNEDDATKALRARNAELGRSIPLLKAEAQAAAEAAKNIQSQRSGTGQLPGTRVEALSDAEAIARRTKARDDEVEALKTANKENLFGIDLLPRLHALQENLTNALARQNLTLAEQVKLRNQLKDLAEIELRRGLRTPPLSILPSSDRTIGTSGSIQRGGTKEKPTLTLTPVARARLGLEGDFRAEMAALEEELANSLAQSIATGIANGFAQGLAQGGIGEGFRQMTAQVLASLGQMAIQVAISSIRIGKEMKTLQAAMASWNPFLVIAAGVALAALGTKLGGRRAGGAVGGLATGGGGGVGGDDGIRSFIYGPNSALPLNYVPASIRAAVGSLRGAVLPSAPEWGLGGLQPLVVNSASGRSFVAREVNFFNRERGGR